MCTGRATSCNNKSRRLITLCVQVGRLVAATRCGDISLRVKRSGDKLQQQVETTYHSVCTGRATSCSNTLRRHITPCEQVGRLDAATRYGGTSQRQIAWCVLKDICENLCLCNRICRRNKSITHEAICGCDMLLQFKLRIVPHFSRASETRALVKITPREKGETRKGERTVAPRASPAVSRLSFLG